MRVATVFGRVLWHLMENGCLHHACLLFPKLLPKERVVCAWTVRAWRSLIAHCDRVFIIIHFHTIVYIFFRGNRCRLF